MKRWALLTVGLYMLILLALAGPVFCLSMADDISGIWSILSKVYDIRLGISATSMSKSDRWIGFVCSPYIWAGVMGLAQAALLAVPVRFASRKPVTTRWLIWPALAALAMLLLLTAAMLLGAVETADNTPSLSDPTVMIAVACGVGAVWSIWAFLFAFYTIRGGRANFMTRLTRSLVAGSILELLVAVPAHVLARTRNYCCAGFGTFWGIAAGVSVMLFAFGPAVFVLFARRYGDLRRPPKAPVTGGLETPQRVSRDAGDAGERQETN